MFVYDAKFALKTFKVLISKITFSQTTAIRRYSPLLNLNNIWNKVFELSDNFLNTFLSSFFFCSYTFISNFLKFFIILKNFSSRNDFDCKTNTLKITTYIYNPTKIWPIIFLFVPIQYSDKMMLCSQIGTKLGRSGYYT